VEQKKRQWRDERISLWRLSGPSFRLRRFRYYRRAKLLRSLLAYLRGDPKAYGALSVSPALKKKATAGPHRDRHRLITERVSA
jgi:hypothetical protein